MARGCRAGGSPLIPDRAGSAWHLASCTGLYRQADLAELVGQGIAQQRRAARQPAARHCLTGQFRDSWDQERLRRSLAMNGIHGSVKAGLTQW
jgi:hypothetical protein